MESTREIFEDKKHQVEKKSNVDAFLAKLNAPGQVAVMEEFGKWAEKFKLTNPSLQNAGEKYLALMLMLNSGSKSASLFSLESPLLVEFYLPFMMTNVPEMMQKGFDAAQEAGAATTQSNLLQHCAITASADNFNKMCELLNLAVHGVEYQTLMTRPNPALRIPVAPLFIAAYCGNYSLLHDMCTHLDRTSLTELEEHTGLSLMHFAAMGGDMKIIEYLFNVQGLLLDKASRSSITPFAYLALSNNPEAVARFIDLGYQPTKKDKLDFNDLYHNNDITELRKRFTQSAIAHDMPYALREAMGDPSILAVKAARKMIEQQVTNTKNLLLEMIIGARELVKADSLFELQNTKTLAQDIVNNAHEQILSFIHLINDAPGLGDRIQQALHEIDGKLNELLAVNASVAPLRRSSSPQPSLGYSSAPKPSSPSLSDLSFRSQAPLPSSSAPLPSSSPRLTSAPLSSPSSSSTHRMMSDLEWERQVEANIALTRAETSSPRVVEDYYPDMLDLTLDDFESVPEELYDFASEKNEEDKREKKSPKR